MRTFDPTASTVALSLEGTGTGSGDSGAGLTVDSMATPAEAEFPTLTTGRSIFA